MAAKQAVIKLNQITHCVQYVFVSLSAHERVCTCETFENMNVLGLLLRQMKWPAWGDGRSSEEEKRE